MKHFGKIGAIFSGLAAIIPHYVPPQYSQLVAYALGGLGAAALWLAKSPWASDSLQATPGVDDAGAGPVAGKAAGEAGSTASKGPFGGAR